MKPIQFQPGKSFAAELDKNDSLHSFRELFLIPSHNGDQAIYFLGNSLGLQPKNAETYIKKILSQWASQGVESFFKGKEPWLDYHDFLVKPLAEIVGAKPSEIVVMNQLTVNLHLMLASFYRPEGKRNKIICETKAFPSDQYMLETHIQLRGFDPGEVIVEIGSPDGLVKTEEIIRMIEEKKDEVALVLLGGVNYYSGQVLDMAAIAAKARSCGAYVGFDLAHAAGNVPLQLHAWEVDFACWCSYKYLNSGPGAIAGCFIHERYHDDKDLHRMAGWWGYNKEKRFLMQKGFVPAASAQGWQLSTPSPILYALHRASLEIFMEAGLEKIFLKGQNLSSYLLFLLQLIQKKYSETLHIITPSEDWEKGCQVSMMVKHNGKKVFNYITEKGIFADWREPDVIRVAPVPLYNSFSEVFLFAELLEEAILKFNA